MPGAWNVVARRSLYVWRGPCFRMHWCRFETPVSVWSILHFGNLMSVHLVPLGRGEYAQPTNEPPWIPKQAGQEHVFSFYDELSPEELVKDGRRCFCDRYDRSWISGPRWCFRRFTGFLRIEKKSWFQRCVIFVPGKCSSNLYKYAWYIWRFISSNCPFAGCVDSPKNSEC